MASVSAGHIVLTPTQPVPETETDIQTDRQTETDKYANFQPEEESSGGRG